MKIDHHTQEPVQAFETRLSRGLEHIASQTPTRSPLEFDPDALPLAVTDTSPNRRLVPYLTAAAAAAVIVAGLVAITHGGPVEVAQAAWSANPAMPTAEQITRLTTQCDADVRTVLEAGLLEAGGDPSALSADHFQPVLSEMRGTTALAVYVSPGAVALCATFADGSIIVRGISGAQEPGQTLARGLDIDGKLYTVVTGLLPSEAATGGNVTIRPPGQEDVTATVIGERYAAWLPTPANFTITYTREDGTTRELGPFPTEELAVDEYAPVTTVVGPGPGPGPASGPEPSPNACEQDPSPTACDD